MRSEQAVITMNEIMPDVGLNGFPDGRSGIAGLIDLSELQITK